VVLPPIPTERQGRLRADVTRVTQDLARSLEQLISAAPEQWHLMQPNWPSDEAALQRFRQQRGGLDRFGDDDRQRQAKSERIGEQRVPG